MNIQTQIINDEQYKELMDLIRNGDVTGHIQPNEQIYTALYLSATTGLRIGDCLQLTLSNIVKDGQIYRLNIDEDKTGKRKTDKIPQTLYDQLIAVAGMNGIEDKHTPIFTVGERTVQKLLAKCKDWLGDDYAMVSCHSFRKYSAMKRYVASGYNIIAVQKFLNHSSVAVTQRYLGLDQAEQDELADKCFIEPTAKR